MSAVSVPDWADHLMRATSQSVAYGSMLEIR